MTIRRNHTKSYAVYQFIQDQGAPVSAWKIGQHFNDTETRCIRSIIQYLKGNGFIKRAGTYKRDDGSNVAMYTVHEENPYKILKIDCKSNSSVKSVFLDHDVLTAIDSLYDKSVSTKHTFVNNLLRKVLGINQ